MPAVITFYAAINNRDLARRWNATDGHGANEAVMAHALDGVHRGGSVIREIREPIGAGPRRGMSDSWRADVNIQPWEGLRTPLPEASQAGATGHGVPSNFQPGARP